VYFVSSVAILLIEALTFTNASSCFGALIGFQLFETSDSIMDIVDEGIAAPSIFPSASCQFWSGCLIGSNTTGLRT
jgi:hypothetical protein